MTTTLLQPPYYAVIFTSIRTEGDNGYAEMGEEMEKLAQTQSGFLGMDSVRNGLGITVSYWQTEADILNWKKNMQHQYAQKQGRGVWYAAYTVRVCKVERHYGFEAEKGYV